MEKPKPKQDTVCLRVKPETRDELKTVGKSGDTVDSVIKALILEHKMIFEHKPTKKDTKETLALKKQAAEIGERVYRTGDLSESVAVNDYVEIVKALPADKREVLTDYVITYLEELYRDPTLNNVYSDASPLIDAVELVRKQEAEGGEGDE